MTARISASEVNEIAADWVARKDHCTLTEEENAELEAWLAEDPRHLGAFIRTEAYWSRLDRLASLRNATLSEKSAPSFSYWRLSAAASIILVLLGSALVYYYGRTSHQVLATAIGEVHLVNREDGSSIELNTTSGVDIIYGRRQRTVQLVRGEAYFEVAKDSRRPFVVESGDYKITAIGTSFNVHRTSAEAGTVIVDEGTVQVQSKDNSEIIGVAAGHKLAFNDGAPILTTISTAEIERETAWRQGRVVFEGETLAAAVEEFNRYNIRHIIIAQPEIGNLMIGGVFRTADIKGFSQHLADTFGLIVVDDSNGSLIVEEPPANQRPHATTEKKGNPR